MYFQAVSARLHKDYHVKSKTPNAQTSTWLVYGASPLSNSGAAYIFVPHIVFMTVLGVKIFDRPKSVNLIRVCVFADFKSTFAGCG